MLGLLPFLILLPIHKGNIKIIENNIYFKRCKLEMAIILR